MAAYEPPTIPGPLVGGPSPKIPLSAHPMSWSRRLIQRVLAPFVLAFLRGLWMTCRFEISGEAKVAAPAASGKPVIVTFWHGELAVGAWYLRRLESLGLKLTFVVSPSKDGELVMRILERSGGGYSICSGT